MIGIEFDEFAQISLNSDLNMLGSLHAVVLKLKRVDPYVCNSRVLGYQLADRTIFLEDLEDPEGFYRHVRARGRVVPLAVKDEANQCQGR